ncbi:MAG: hypothetical protein ACFE8B_14875 [Candidatus Hermodarchaeota archaeon]
MSEITRKYKGNARKVRIWDAYKGDAGRGRIRIDPAVIREMNLKNGDVIEIANSNEGKKTAALLFPGKEEDRGSGSIRIDASLRRNLGASLDDMVEIGKIDARLANRITFAGLNESVIIRRSDQFVRMLENRVFTKGDILSFNAMGRKIDFIVVDYAPKAAAVRIHLDTKITVSGPLCRYCGKEPSDQDQEICEYCGSDLLKSKNLSLCRYCGKEPSEPDQVICEYCESELNHNQ